MEMRYLRSLCLVARVERVGTREVRRQVWLEDVLVRNSEMSE